VYLLVSNSRQWVVDVIPCRRPHADGCETELSFGFQVSSFNVLSGFALETGNLKLEILIGRCDLPQGLKPHTLSTESDGLKAVPFKTNFFKTNFSRRLRLKF
jgi:hypothetical protein